MKRSMIKWIPLVAIVLAAFTAPRHKRIRIWIIGDSTAANKSAKAFPETGWGMKLQAFFDSTKAVVDNRALNGRSTLSFRNEGRWQPVYDSLQPGDYVLIEFGHNDEKVDKPGVGVSHADYKANLARYVQETRSRKAIPVLLTPIARRSFVNGQLENTHQGYPDVVRQLADSLQVPLIDMELKTTALIRQLGETESIRLFNHLDSGHVNYPKGVKDNTHLSPSGATAIAGLAAQGIRELKLQLVKYMYRR